MVFKLFFSFQRFPSPKFNKPKAVTNSNVRYKMNTATLEDEKLLELDADKVECNSLSWLFGVAPAFPIDGSKARMFNNLHYV